MRYEQDIEVERDPAEVFAYVADFSRASEWDPGIEESRRLSDGPTSKGSRFELIARFRGNRQRFEYVVTDYVDGRRIALHGEGGKAVSDDTISVEAKDGGTRLTYTADIRLKGAYRLFEPLLRRTFARMGDDALAGLETHLSR